MLFLYSVILLKNFEEYASTIEEFFYSPGLKDRLNMKSTVKSILEILLGYIPGGELKDGK